MYFFCFWICVPVSCSTNIWQTITLQIQVPLWNHLKLVGWISYCLKNYLSSWLCYINAILHRWYSSVINITMDKDEEFANFGVTSSCECLEQETSIVLMKCLVEQWKEHLPTLKQTRIIIQQEKMIINILMILVRCQ